MKESLVNKDSNNTEERNSKRRKKVSMIIKEQLYDIIEQNQIYNSINQMNKYIQSPRYFKFIFNVKRKSLNCLCYIKNFFRYNSNTTNLFRLNGEASSHKSFISSSLLISVICISLGISFISHRLNLYKSKHNSLTEKEISDLKKQNNELIAQNKKLIALINKRI